MYGLFFHILYENKIILGIKKYTIYKMGSIYSRYKKPTPDQSSRIIIINQAICHLCTSVVVSKGVCKCGNVEVYGDLQELGRKVKDVSKYSDCNLIEYRT
jgi:hypothetical protein